MDPQNHIEFKIRVLIGTYGSGSGYKILLLELEILNFFYLHEIYNSKCSSMGCKIASKQLS